MERTLTYAALNTLIAERAEIAVLDVRRRPAFEAEPRLITGAVWREPGEVEIWADALNRNRPVVVYCVHGHEVSQGVVDRLRAFGFDAALLEGGIEAWKASGGPVTEATAGSRAMPGGRSLLKPVGSACAGLLALILAGLLSAGLGRPAAAGPAQALVLERKIPLGEVRGRIDHLAIDLDRDRLFVAELGNDSLGVVDLAAGRVLRRLGELDEPQGVAYDPATDTVYVADGGDGSVHRFEGAELTPLDPIQLGGDADNVRLDPEAGAVVVGYGDGALALVDAASGKLTAEIRLPGHPESFQLEHGGPRIFVNVPDAHQIAVVDRSTGRQVASWGLADARANFPMALDEAAGRLVIGYRDPALLAVFETVSGAPVARLPACGDTDDVFLDSQRHRLYLSCGAGFLDVIQQRGDSYEELARVPTVAGARTALFVPERDRLYLAVRASGPERAAVWVFRPTPR